MLVDEILHGLACKAAIKAGDPLSQAEVDALVRERRSVPDSHHCPHGRPTSLTLSRLELDRQFRRT
jgi:DNA mismatch repair protein MutL